MVFVRRIKGYYILAHSIREGGRVRQRTRYLGKHLPAKPRLAQLKKEFLAELSGAKHRYLSLKEADAIERKKEQALREEVSLSSLERKKKVQEFMIRYTYDSSKLSGVDVTLRQTYLILKDGIVPKGFRNLRTVRELENHEKGIIAITRFRGSLNIRFMKKLHLILFSGVDDEIAGKLRSELKRNVKIGGTAYVPPHWGKVENELASFFIWLKAEGRRLHPIELSALIHLKLISLQPFADGNSRLSRLLMNWVLWKKKYPLIDIEADDLEAYYAAADIYQIEKDERPFIKYIIRKYLEAKI